MDMISSKAWKLAFICAMFQLSIIPGVRGQPVPCNNGAVLSGFINTGVLNQVGDCTIVSATVNGPFETVNGGIVTISNSAINGDFGSTNTGAIIIKGMSDFTGDFEASGLTAIDIDNSRFNDFQGTGLASASIKRSEMSGDFEVESVAGPVNVARNNVGGPMTVNGVNGKLTVESNDVGGGIVVQGVNGDVSVLSNSINGGITLNGATGFIDVNGNTINGGIACDNLDKPPSGAQLSADNDLNGNLERQCAF